MLAFVVAQLLGVILLSLGLASGAIIGVSRLTETRRMYRERFESVAPYVGLLAVVLVANKIARDIGPNVSWLIGIRITDVLKRIDSRLLWPLFPENTPHVVVWFQSMATPELTAYFSVIYVYGYVFLLVFPFVAYFALPTPQPLRRTIVAYSSNYVIGVICYVIFIAYGPRLTIPDFTEGLLYTTYSEYQFVTNAVNNQTNVFPSLHTSMAVTSFLLAWTTRDEYPRWVPIAAVLAVSVVISTMYLGIHWATDAIFGIVLGWVSVRIGQRMEETPPTFGAVGDRIRGVFDAIPTRPR
ncbi:MAG: membrane-associated phospholipid phosphatase [Natronomonas sp.]|jgi:membrane-associated phospholipid phosphatase|uniref:phosphatase PAP2 family protein n=1 Tax=Natronomonas sp. TaxID=2184060 RepID=UPI00398934A5